MKVRRFAVSVLALFATFAVWAKTETVDGITWTYTIKDDSKAEVANGTNTAIPPDTTGAIVIPAMLGDKPVTSIGNYAFRNCRGLTSVTIPRSVTSIGNYAFDGCSGLTSVTIPSSVTSIGEFAFFGCSLLFKLCIDSVESWCKISFANSGSNPFYSSSEKTLVVGGQPTTELVIPAGVTAISAYAFHNWSMITSVTIPEGVTSIGDSAFSVCSGLTSVAIPAGVTSIGSDAFNGCSGLTSVTIPSSVESIGSWAFFDCSSLKQATVLAEKPPTGGTKMFNGTANDFVILVPEESVTNYKGAEGWKTYENQIQAAPRAGVHFTAGEGVEKIEFKCYGKSEFVEFPAGGTNLVIGALIDIQVSVTEFYRYTGDTQFLVTDDGIEMGIAATWIAPGDEARPWVAGDAVTAYTNGVGGLVIQGSGAMYDFADAEDVPWADVAKEVTAVTIEETVTKVGGNALAGLNDTVMVNGTPVANIRPYAQGFCSAGTVIPDDKVLVAKEELQAAKAEAVTVADGVVSLGVTVNTNGNFTAETKSWQPVELKSENVKVENGKIVISIPVGDKSGFMILQSGDAKVGVTSGGGPAANHAVQVAGGLYLDGGAEDQVVRIDGIDTRVLGNTAKKANDDSSDE